MGEMVFHGNQPVGEMGTIPAVAAVHRAADLLLLEVRYCRGASCDADRQDEVLQFVERSNRTYSIVYRGMTFKRCDNLREGAGGEFSCSEEGGGYIQETGFTCGSGVELMRSPVKKKSCVCRQWSVGPGIFLRVYDVGAECL